MSTNEQQSVVGDGRTESLEIERKYEVQVRVALPAAEAWAAIGVTADAPHTVLLEASYFDTPEGDLAARGLAMRVRRGGKDAGWHLKQRGAVGVHEMLWEPSEHAPDELLAEVRERVGEAAERVAPVATIRTERTIVLLRDAAGRAVVEIADDRVRAEDGDGVRRVWREWESEALDSADAELLDRVEPVLLAAGATHSLSFAKIARATGQLVAVAVAAGASEEAIAQLRALDASDQDAARRLEA